MISETAHMLFVGDIALGGEWAFQNGTGMPKWTEPFFDLQSTFHESDLRIGNLESPLFLSSKPQHKLNLLGAPPDSVEALRFLGFTTLNLANNHLTDQGPEGIIKTCEILNNCKIAYFGAGENLNAALRPAFAYSNGLSFAFLGYAALLQEVGAQAATETRAGCAPLSLERIAQDIATVRGKVSHIVVSLHWGYQYDHLPEPSQVELARKIIDLGALVVFGHHPHVVQGIERYRNGLILYSLGNFFLPDFKRTDGCWFHFPKESRRTVIVRCAVGAKGVSSVTMIPLLVGTDSRIHVLSGDTAIRAIAEFDRRSAELYKVDYLERWSVLHKKNMAWRARTDRRLWLYCKVIAVLNRVRTRGLMTSLIQLRTRHLINSLRQLWRFIRRNHP